MSLREKIAAEIRTAGAMPFSRYMDLCLYDPEYGYYMRATEQFGKAGDFYTSSDVHAVFGRLLARQFEGMWRALGAPAQIEILELGPGRGLFAQDVLDWSAKKFPEFFAVLRYSLAERSCALRERLRSLLAKHLEDGKAALCAMQPLASCGGERQHPGAWFPVRTLPDGTPLIIFANEFFDALPVEVIGAQGELHLDIQDGRNTEIWAPSGSATLEFLDGYGVHPEPGERVEAGLLAQQYARRAAGLIGRGFMIAIDYGYTREEQLAGRHRGTITAYRQHSVSANPYEAPGEQDITAHVNFTALAAALEAGGMKTHALLTQSQFLLGIGENNQFADAFEECSLPQERAKVALQLKHLITPEGVGETFHVLVASKGVDPALAAGLSGLNFGKNFGTRR